MDRHEAAHRLEEAVGYCTVLRMAAEDPRPGREPLTARAREGLAELQPALAALDPMERRVVQARFLDGIYGRCIPWQAVALKLYGKDGPGAVKAAQRLYWSALDALVAYWSAAQDPAPLAM